MLRWKEAKEYRGRSDIRVACSIGLEFSCSITPVCKAGISEPVVPGVYSCSVAPSRVAAPGGRVTVHATVKSGDITKAAGFIVAHVTIKVRPYLVWNYVALPGDKEEE